MHLCYQQISRLLMHLGLFHHQNSQYQGLFECSRNMSKNAINRVIYVRLSRVPLTPSIYLHL